MPVGVTLMRANGKFYYSPPFARGESAASLTIEVLINVGNATLDVTVQHKNSEDTSWASAGTFTQFTAEETNTANVTGLKEMVRYMYAVGGDAGDFVHMFVYAPSWSSV